MADKAQTIQVDWNKGWETSELTKGDLMRLLKNMPDDTLICVGRSHDVKVVYAPSYLVSWKEGEDVQRIERICLYDNEKK